MIFGQSTLLHIADNIIIHHRTLKKVYIKVYQSVWSRSLHQSPGPVLSAACLLQQWGYWCLAVCLQCPESHSHWKKYFTLDIKLISYWCDCIKSVIQGILTCHWPEDPLVLFLTLSLETAGPQGLCPSHRPCPLEETHSPCGDTEWAAGRHGSNLNLIKDHH